MRKKSEKPTGFGVADGLDFSTDTDMAEPITSEARPKAKKPVQAQGINSEIDPTRSYSKYYTPKPRKGAKGGALGRGPIEEAERKKQFSLTCTTAQKERFQEAAKKDQRKFPEFICHAVEEYIKNHNL